MRCNTNAGMASPASLRLISLRLPADLLTRVDQIAGAKGESRTASIERLIRDGIDDEENFVRMATDPVVGPAIFGAFAKPEVVRALMQALRQDLTDEQLDLFQRGVSTLDQQLHAKPAAATAATPRRRPRAKSRSKRRK